MAGKVGKHFGQSKWGRHFCRPHSHQRVGTLLCSPAWQASPYAHQGTLGARCLMLAISTSEEVSLISFVTGARAGIRLSPASRCVFFEPKLSVYTAAFSAQPRLSHCNANLLKRSPASLLTHSLDDRPASTAFLLVKHHKAFNDPTCIQPKLFACHLSGLAWTATTRTFEIKTSENHDLTAWFSNVRLPKTARDCACRSVWARVARASFPLFPRSPVDGSGELNGSSHFSHAGDCPSAGWPCGLVQARSGAL